MDLKVLTFCKSTARRIRFIPSWWDREDVLQECYVAYIELAPQYPPDCAVPRDTWLWRKVVTRVKQKAGRVRRGDTGEVDALPDTRTPPHPDAKMDKQTLMDIVGFTPVERTVMTLRYDEGLTHQMIADRLERSRPYISEVIKRAHQRAEAYFTENDLCSDSVLGV